jgi:hypothetical protein
LWFTVQTQLHFATHFIKHREAYSRKNTHSLRLFLLGTSSSHLSLLHLPLSYFSLSFATHFYQLHRFLQEKQALLLLQKQKPDLKLPDTVGWQRITFYTQYLQPIAELITYCEGNGVILGKVPAKIQGLLAGLVNQEYDLPLAKEIKQILRDSIQTRLHDVYKEPQLPLLGAALDPEYGNLQFISEELRSAVRTRLFKEAVDLYHQPPFNSEGVSNAEISAQLNSLYELFENGTEDRGDPLDFWNQRLTRFSLLIPLVQMILCIPPTSTESERSFSSTSYIQRGRSQLGPVKLEQTTVVRNQLQQPTMTDKERANLINNLAALPDHRNPLVSSPSFIHTCL